MKISLKLLVFIIVLTILNCKNKPSTTLPEKKHPLTNLGLQIEIRDYAKKNYRPSIKASIINLGENSLPVYDIFVNGTPLEFIVKRRLYYTKERYFFLREFPRQESYHFEVMLKDSIKYSVGHISPKKINDKAQFTIPKYFNTDSIYEFKWKNLNVPHKLKLIKGIKSRNPDIIQYAYSGRIDTELTKNIGKHTLPQSYFKDSLNFTTHIEVEITAEEKGVLNPNLFESSSIINYYKLDLNIYPKDGN